MYRFLIILSILATFTNTAVFANARVIRTTPHTHSSTPYHHYQNNYHHNPNYCNKPYQSHGFYNDHRYHPQSHFSDINALEKYSMNRNFGRESDLQRLQRLEMQAFGAVQSGDINRRYDNVRNAILSRPNYSNTKTSFLRNIGNYFSGQMTGFTPSPDNTFNPFTSTPYPTNYGNQSYNEYSGPFGSGHWFENSGTGSSSSIKILD